MEFPSLRRFVNGFLALGFFLVLSQTCFADDAFRNDAIDGQDEKLSFLTCYSDWWESRPRAQAEDPWFVLDSASPCEFYFGSSYIGTQSGNTSIPGWETYVGGYVSIFGLEGRYATGPDTRWFGQGNIRIYGLHDQGNNLTLNAGIRSVDGSLGSYRNGYVGVSGTAYLHRRFGLTGLYRYFFPSSPSSSGYVSGWRYELGAFIDFRLFRLQGNYFNDIESNETLSGFQLGIRLYF